MTTDVTLSTGCSKIIIRSWLDLNVWESHLILVIDTSQYMLVLAWILLYEYMKWRQVQYVVYPK